MYSILTAWVRGQTKHIFFPAADVLFLCRLACCRSRDPRLQFQRKWIWRGRSAPSLTSGLWNSRPAREWMFAQQNSQ